MLIPPQRTDSPPWGGAQLIDVIVLPTGLAALAGGGAIIRAALRVPSAPALPSLST
jgi:hypothetical protein